MNSPIFQCLVFTVVVLCVATSVEAQSTEFTYQGRLLSGEMPANGSHDFEFTLWDDEFGGNQIGSVVTLTEVNVNNGVFLGQANSGSTAAGGIFHLIDGLWATENLSASSPFAAVEGHVIRGIHVGVVRASVAVTSATTNTIYQTWTGPFGYYRFTNIPTGANYTITVRHPHFEFAPNVLSLFISQDRSNVNFFSTQ